MPEPISLIGLNRAQLTEALSPFGVQTYRANQVAEWIYLKHVSKFSEMSNLPSPLRESLAETFSINPLQVVSHVKSKDDVDKLLVHSGDNQSFECVLLPFASRVSCCLSSQIGCAMGCTFCATGIGGFDRNLSVSEIVSQYLLLQSLSSRRISHVVFMGMGEPLLNYENLICALRIFHEEIGLSYRHITVSTVGIVPNIVRLSKENLPIHLAISLHSPFDEIRSEMMPVDKKWPIKELIETAKEWTQQTGRKVTFEYLLINDVTDTAEQAEELSRLVSGFPSIVNLIPFNFVDTGQGFTRPASKRVRAFRSILESKGVVTTQRMERGHEIAAACGQLKGHHEGRFGKRRNLSFLPQQ